MLGISYMTWVKTHSSLCNAEGEFIAYEWALHKPQACWKIMARRSQASPYSRLQALCLVSFLLGTPSPGPSAGLWHLYANPSSQNCSQGGGDGAHISNTWVVTALGLWETRVTFLPLPIGIDVSNSHIPPTSLGNSLQRVCTHRILIVAGPKKKPFFSATWWLGEQRKPDSVTNLN